MTRRRKLDRRTLLRGAAGVALGLPWLEAMGVARAADDTPRRLVLVFTSNGTDPGAWTPGPGFSLGPILAPLEPHQSDIAVLSGIDMHSSGGDNKGHNRGVGALWTGTEPLGGNDGESSYAQSPSVDQAIAQQLGPVTQLASLELGVRVYFTIPRGRMIYDPSGQPVAPEESPWKAYNRLFGDFGTDEEELARIRARRASVLDAVQEDLSRLQTRLGRGDRAKLESHGEAIRAIERRLDTLGSPNPACEPPVLGDPVNVQNNANFPLIGDLQMDLLVMALTCDLTRVASLMWSSALSGAVHTWLGHDQAHHTYSHELSNPASRAKIVEINTWYAERFASLLERMKAIPEGDGTLLDNSVVCWGSELGKGQPHYCKNIPFVIAGSCGGRIATGKHIAYDGESHNNLLLTLMHAMGVEAQTFGDSAFCSGPLSELLVAKG